jgi:hypothetical protein
MGMFGFVSGARKRIVIVLAAAAAIVLALGTVIALNAGDDSVQIAEGDGTTPTSHDHAKMLRDQAAAAAAGEHHHDATVGSSSGTDHAAHDDTNADGHHTSGSTKGSSHGHSSSSGSSSGSSATHAHTQTATGGTTPHGDGHTHTTTPGGSSSTPTTHGHHTPGSSTPGSTSPPDPDGPPRSSAEQALIDSTRAEVATIPNNEAGVIAAGYIWIGDEVGGFRHYVNWTNYFDGIEMDPGHIESLVMKRQSNGSLRIETAMYILNQGKTLNDTPTIPGNLTSWHNHTDLCWRGDFDPPVDPNNPPRLAGCGSAGAVHIVTPPMIHVWLKYTPPNPLVVQCGPFVGVDGHGAGCSHSH